MSDKKKDWAQEGLNYLEKLAAGNEVENYLNSMEDSSENDEAVNAPSHYLQGRSIEPLDVIEDWGLDEDYYLASVVKYIARYGRKEGVVGTQCLRKARFYLDRKIRNAGR